MYYNSFIDNINKNYKKSPKFIFILRNPIDRYNFSLLVDERFRLREKQYKGCDK
jgi:hypothetical protein